MSSLFRQLAQRILSTGRPPVFEPRSRVNRVTHAGLDRWDGRVLAQTSAGVLVEWPRHGAQWEDASRLCLQG